MTNTLSTKLLLVDDDLKLCRLICSYLEPMGYSVSTAHNGTEGLAMALAGEYDAMILDVMLPQLDGFEVLKRLRAHSNLPVLMLTGLGDDPKAPRYVQTIRGVGYMMLKPGTAAE